MDAELTVLMVREDFWGFGWSVGFTSHGDAADRQAAPLARLHAAVRTSHLSYTRLAGTTLGHWSCMKPKHRWPHGGLIYQASFPLLSKTFTTQILDLTVNDVAFALGKQIHQIQSYRHKSLKPPKKGVWKRSDVW